VENLFREMAAHPMSGRHVTWAQSDIIFLASCGRQSHALRPLKGVMLRSSFSRSAVLVEAVTASAVSGATCQEMLNQMGMSSDESKGENRKNDIWLMRKARSWHDEAIVKTCVQVTPNKKNYLLG